VRQADRLGDDQRRAVMIGGEPPQPTFQEDAQLGIGRVAGILYRLRHRGRLQFERRDDRHDGLDPEYQFTIPTEMPEQIERTRVWATKEVKKR
jgi:hypothetical protein